MRGQRRTGEGEREQGGPRSSRGWSFFPALGTSPVSSGAVLVQAGAAHRDKVYLSPEKTALDLLWGSSTLAAVPWSLLQQEWGGMSQAACPCCS